MNYEYEDDDDNNRDNIIELIMLGVDDVYKDIRFNTNALLLYKIKNTFENDVTNLIELFDYTDLFK